MTGNNRTTWLRDDGSTSSKPAASPDWRGEVAQNIRGPGTGSNPQGKALQAWANTPSPQNFSGGGRLTGGFGPGDPRNTDHYWRAVAKAPGERAEAVRHNALAQEAAAKFPYGPQSGGHVPSLRSSTRRHPHMDPAFMRSFSERKAALKSGRGTPTTPSAGTDVTADLWGQFNDAAATVPGDNWMQETRDRQLSGLDEILSRGAAPVDGASSFDTSFQSILQLLED